MADTRRTFCVVVRDPLRFPVPGAIVSVGQAVQGATNAAGILVFELTLPDDAGVTVGVQVPGAQLVWGGRPPVLGFVMVPASAGRDVVDIRVTARWPVPITRVAGWQNPILRSRFFPFRFVMLQRFLYIDALCHHAERLHGSPEELAKAETEIDADVTRLAKLPAPAVANRPLLHEGADPKKYGDAIKEAKTKLNLYRGERKKLDPAVARFERDMYDAVVTFQRERAKEGLKVDGMVGPQTWFELLHPPESEKRAEIARALEERKRLTERLLGVDATKPTDIKARAVRASHYLGNMLLEEVQGKSQAELLKRIGSVFERDARERSDPAKRRYPPWVQYVIIHASGLIYKNDHVTLFDHRRLIEALRLTKLKQLQQPTGASSENAAPRTNAASDERCPLDLEARACTDNVVVMAWGRDILATADGPPHARGDAVKKLGDLMRVHPNASALSSSDRTRLLTAVQKAEEEVFQRVVGDAGLAAWLEHLASRRPQGDSAAPAPGNGRFRAGAWRRIVFHTALRAQFVGAEAPWYVPTLIEDSLDAPKVQWDPSGSSWSIPALPEPEPEWGVVFAAPRQTAWREFIRSTRWPVLVNAVCNELSEYAQYARGAVHPGGLRENAMAVANASGLRRNRAANQAKPGDCIFYIDWRTQTEIADRSNAFPAMEVVLGPVGETMTIKARSTEDRIDPPAPPVETRVAYKRLKVPGADFDPRADRKQYKEKVAVSEPKVDLLTPSQDKTHQVLSPSIEVSTPPDTTGRYHVEQPLGDRDVARRALGGAGKNVQLFASWSHEAVVLFWDPMHQFLVALDASHPIGVNLVSQATFAKAHTGSIPVSQTRDLDAFLDIAALLGRDDPSLADFLKNDKPDARGGKAPQKNDVPIYAPRTRA